MIRVLNLLKKLCNKLVMATAQKSEVKLVHMADNGENETVVQNRDESKHYSLTTGKKKKFQNFTITFCIIKYYFL